MTDALFILNAGSSSLKFSVFRDSDPPELLLRGQCEGLLTAPNFSAQDATGNQVGSQAWTTGAAVGHKQAIECLFDWGQHAGWNKYKIVGAGHRVVHGGTKFTQPVRVDGAVLNELESLIPLAPLHQPHNLAAIRAVSERNPNLTQIACFDTSFHRTQPQLAQQFALPEELTASGIQRYGFHGLSYEYVIGKLKEIAPETAAGRVIVAHLGNGASLCAVHKGVSVATTMGFTPLDGLVMGTRCGSIDPGALIYLMDQRGMDARAIEHLLYHESGLLGVSGRSSDMRELLAHAPHDPRCASAIELFVYRIVREIGSMAAAMGGVDALIFTGGIGEHSPIIRDRVCESLNWLGLELDPTANQRHGPAISTDASRIQAWVIPTNEELMIARHLQRLLKPPSVV